MPDYREGSLAAPMRHPIQWGDEDYYDHFTLSTATINPEFTGNLSTTVSIIR